MYHCTTNRISWAHLFAIWFDLDFQKMGTVKVVCPTTFRGESCRNQGWLWSTLSGNDSFKWSFPEHDSSKSIVSNLSIFIANITFTVVQKNKTSPCDTNSEYKLEVKDKSLSWLRRNQLKQILILWVWKPWNGPEMWFL